MNRLQFANYVALHFTLPHASSHRRTSIHVSIRYVFSGDRKVDVPRGSDFFQRAFNAAPCFFNATLNQGILQNGPRSGNHTFDAELSTRYQRGFNAVSRPPFWDSLVTRRPKGETPDIQRKSKEMRGNSRKTITSKQIDGNTRKIKENHL